MSISAGDVKKLRDMTGAGMMDAKKSTKWKWWWFWQSC